MNGQRRALDDDVLDLTAIDDNDPIPDFSAVPLAGRANAKASKTDDILIFSDDFDSSGSELADDFDPFEPRPAKKRRVSGDSDLISGGDREKTAQAPAKFATKRTREGPGVLQPAGPRKQNAPSDPIEFTSSPQLLRSSNKRDAISSDPFASPPPQFEEKENIISLLDDDDDDDPFAIAPLKATAKPMMPPKGGRKREPSPGLPENKPRQAQKRSQGSKNSAVWDNISSSAPEASVREDQWGLDFQSSRNGLERSRSGGIDLGDLADFPMSSDDDEDEEFPDIGGIKRSKRSFNGKSKAATMSRTSGSKPSTSKTSKTKPTAEDKAAAREAEKLRKQREREEIKEQKRQEKEKAAALAEVNKVRTDKKVSTPEMIVDLPTSMNPSVRLQVEALLEDLNVRHYPYASPVNNVVKWRRRVRARFNDDEGYWEPIPAERIETERHAMVIMPAAEFVELALGLKGSDLEAHVLQMQRHYDGDQLIYMIEGLTPWMRKNRNVRNRQFQSAVRNAGADAEADAEAGAANAPPPSSQAPSGRRKKDPKPPPAYIDEDQVEDALLQLQVMHGVIIHHTAAPIETAQWVSIFTQHISTIPYRRQRDAANESAGFCMDSGQVRTGDSAADTYVRMLQEIARVTAPMADGIAGQYPSVGKLVRGLEAKGPLALEAIRKSANKDGAFTDRPIGPAISRRIHKVFTGREVSSTDI
ncbi:ERCC4 domain-containing protein [Diaporthe helianthi]|uniref:ERCC4 domain-containing protein n=1 Tax=Diaporthe helianthi TaxID=158607 RepID=A0A2P5I7F1_DIAHE|nr:ERCC4 domain-containing protein [Diaporthe helianthi]